MRPFRSVHSLLFAAALVGSTAPAMAGVSLSFSVSIAPPPLPVYVQPDCPGDGYIWTPGYWAYGPDGYFWVPGTWVLAPEPGYLWTPGYWGWSDGMYLFHAGYWGPHVGFYGGINYGCGYGGSGYEGGYWRGDRFYYNRAVNQMNGARVTNVYNRTVVNTTINRVSYNGGSGGVASRPTTEERQAESERHLEPTSAQSRHIEAAGQNRQLLASVNRGKPAFAATARPGDFRNAVPARAAGGRVDPPASRSRPETDSARPRPAPMTERMPPQPVREREAPETRPRPAQQEQRQEQRMEQRQEQRQEQRAPRPAQREPREHEREEHGR
ncbi:MAG TPA: YXWGXW repeat-containing protein [Holophagaceae bacterium]|nr:YXWGXW repeat-containing protein [Holophagaceae bacterium]